MNGFRYPLVGVLFSCWRVRSSPAEAGSRLAGMSGPARAGARDRSAAAHGPWPCRAGNARGRIAPPSGASARPHSQFALSRPPRWSVGSAGREKRGDPSGHYYGSGAPIGSRSAARPSRKPVRLSVPKGRDQHDRAPDPWRLVVSVEVVPLAVLIIPWDGRASADALAPALATT
jgi:hypothetical protein